MGVFLLTEDKLGTKTTNNVLKGYLGIVVYY